VRPWQHVLDGLSGYLLLAQRLYEQGGACAKSYNFGPEDERVVTVGELVKELIGVLGQGEYVFESEAGAPFESGMLRLDSSLARRELQWRTVFDVDAAITYTAEWYRAFLDDREHIRDFTLDQIRRYNERI